MVDTSRRRLLRLLAAAGTASVAGCGFFSDEEPGPKTTTVPPGEETLTDSSTATHTPTPTSTPSPTPLPVLPEGEPVKLAPEDGDVDDWFGSSVALAKDGRTALVGAHRDEDPNGDTAGSAYVFARTASGWVREAKLVPVDGDERDSFGESVALSSDGTRALVGAANDEDPNGAGAGSAYVFDRRDGRWERQAKLSTDDDSANPRFGETTALSADGTTALVGTTPHRLQNSDAEKSAYVFVQAGDGWEQRAALTADDGDGDDRFGESLALSSDGTTVLVGASRDNDPNGDSGGSAYVFARSEEWDQQAKLAPTDGDEGDRFGQSVALSSDGTTALVGAAEDEDPNGFGAGSAYHFERTDGKWEERAKLAADDGGTSDTFGQSVALSSDGTTALVGSDSGGGPDVSFKGSAYAFRRTSGDWGQRSKLVPADGNDGDMFGKVLTVSDDGAIALVAAYKDEDPNGNTAGAAYLFEV